MEKENCKRLKNNLIVQEMLIINEIDTSGYKEFRDPLTRFASSYVKQDCSKEDIEYILKNISIPDSYIHIINKNLNEIKFDASEDAIDKIYEFMNNNINIEKSEEIDLSPVQIKLIDCDNIISIGLYMFRHTDTRKFDFDGDTFNTLIEFDGDPLVVDNTNYIHGKLQ